MSLSIMSTVGELSLYVYRYLREANRDYDVTFFSIKVLMLALDLFVLVVLVQCAQYFAKHKRRKELMENGNLDLSTR